MVREMPGGCETGAERLGLCSEMSPSSFRRPMSQLFIKVLSPRAHISLSAKGTTSWFARTLLFMLDRFSGFCVHPSAEHFSVYIPTLSLPFFVTVWSFWPFSTGHHSFSRFHTTFFLNLFLIFIVDLLPPLPSHPQSTKWLITFHHCGRKIILLLLSFWGQDTCSSRAGWTFT